MIEWDNMQLAVQALPAILAVVSTVASVAGTVVTSVQQKKAADAQQEMHNRAAKNEATRRRRELRLRQAALRAYASGAGISSESASVLAVERRQHENWLIDEGIGSYSRRVAARQAKRQGQAAVTSGILSGASSIVGGATDYFNARGWPGQGQ
jgi:uncharacterized protein HemX